MKPWTKMLFMQCLTTSFFHFFHSIDAAKSQKSTNASIWVSSSICSESWGDSPLLTVFLLTSAGWISSPSPPCEAPSPLSLSSPRTSLVLPYISSFSSTPARSPRAYLFPRPVFLLSNAPLHRGTLESNNGSLCSLDRSWFCEACLKISESGKHNTF